MVGAMLALVPSLTWESADGGPVSQVAPEGIVVVGDSITALYDDEPGSDDQGWWSIVGRHYDADVRTYAQSGSGYLRPGSRCTGTRFVERPQAFEEAASIVLLEGGRNDWAQCVDGSLRTSTNAMVREAVDEYFRAVRRSVADTTRVVVIGPPWGPRQRLEGLRVTHIIRSAAADHAFEFVDTTGTLGPDEVRDGTHPNRAGSLAIADRVIAAIG